MTIAAEDFKEYSNWIPSPIDDKQRFGPASKIAFTARINPKEKGKPAPQGKIHFWLCDVSHEKGQCSNFPQNGDTKDDLRFTPNQAGLIIDPQNPRHAYTEKARDQATVTVEALDTGAYGKLQATCDDLGLVAEDERTKLQSISIPMDDNHNHVADAWEDQKGIKAENLIADWDGEKVSGQKSIGDSITLYENYRGFMVLKDGKPTFVRLDPKQKVLFVIDEGDIFDTTLWLHASDIIAYKLDNGMVKGGAPSDSASRIVDFNSGDGGHKYCVRLIKQQGLVESPPYQNQPPDKITIYGYTDNQGDSPKTTLRCVVFPARIRAMIDRVASYVDKGVKNPSSEDGEALREAGIPSWLAQKALARLDQATRDQLAKQMVTLTAIHEVGHACGLPGHLNDKGEESEQGDPKCPMKYTDRAENRRLMILQVIFALDHSLPLQYDHFCKEGFKCYAVLKVKD
ncbi:MAG: hypothetical protein ABIN58_12940 [candidate division WOR-3 bacterium]